MALRSADRRSVYPSGNAVRRALLTLRGEGVRSFWFKLLGEIGYRRLLLLDQPLIHAVPQFSPTLPVAIAQLAADELDEYLAFRPDTGRAAVIGRLGAGQNVLRRALRPAHRRCRLDRYATYPAVLPRLRARHGAGRRMHLRQVHCFRPIAATASPTHCARITCVSSSAPATGASSLRSSPRTHHRCATSSREVTGRAPSSAGSRSADGNGISGKRRRKSSCFRRPSGTGTSAACIRRTDRARAR